MLHRLYDLLLATLGGLVLANAYHALVLFSRVYGTRRARKCPSSAVDWTAQPQR